VEDIQKMAQVILDNAQDGDVVMCMGAGTIGQVPAQVLALQQAAKK
jgi:UDP-N-acetylmuramate--alanine ligase